MHLDASAERAREDLSLGLAHGLDRSADHALYRRFAWLEGKLERRVFPDRRTIGVHPGHDAGAELLDGLDGEFAGTFTVEGEDSHSAEATEFGAQQPCGFDG